MVVLDELIKGTESKKLDETLKKAFSALSDPVVIDGAENEALLFLINRTIKGNKKFLNKSSLMLLRDESWRRDILKVTEWIHTHNLKYPYSKADGCIFYYEQPLRFRKYKALGYAKDSKQINKCQFLVTEFFWKGNVTSLVEQFAFYGEDGNELVDQLVELGFPEECISVFQEMCSEALNLRLPNSVHQHCKQVRFLQANGKPIAVTPVVCTGTQRTIHKLTKDSDIYGATVFHDRPSSLGTFVSACGGRVRCLCYPPRLGKNDRSTDYLLRQWRYKHHLLNEQALFSKQAFNLLFEVLRSKTDFSTYQSTKAREEKIKHSLQQLVEEIFFDILLLKSRPLSEYQELSEKIDGSIEKSVIKGDFNHEQAANHFTRQVHEFLERSHYSQDLAYQPVLIDVFADGFKSFFKKEGSSKPPEGFIYLHFERLLAYGASCQSNPYLIGLPSLTAFAGLVDSFLLKLGVLERASFAIGLRRFARRKGHPLANQIYRKHTVKNDTVIDSQHCDIEFDLIIRLDVKFLALNLSRHNLYRCLPRRFAGGILSAPIVGTYQQSSLFKRCNLYSNEDELFQGLRLLPSFTRFVVDEAPDMSIVSLDEISEALKMSSTLLPVNKGFKFLGSLSLREGAITDLHAYAGHILGLVKLQPPISVIAFSEIRKQAFWNLHVSQHAVELLSGDPHD